MERKINLYVKTRDLLWFIAQRDFVNPAFRAFSNPENAPLSYNEAYGLAVQVKTARTIRRCVECAVSVSCPIHIIAKEQPARFYRIVFGKTLLCLLQPLLRFQKLLLEFEVFVYADYFGEINREHYQMFEPRPECIKPTQSHNLVSKTHTYTGENI